MNKAVLEGLLFVVGEDGLTLEQIEDVLGVDEDTAKNLIMELKKDYEDETRGLRIDFLGNRFKITTKFEHKEYYQKLIENPETNFLSQAALETLAIVAYNPKITRAEIETIRGVNSDGTIYKLLEHNLIEDTGRLDAPGRPTTYATTKEFLRMFGYTSLEELPELPRYKLDENQQIVIEEIIEENQVLEPEKDETDNNNA